MAYHSKQITNTYNYFTCKNVADHFFKNRKQIKKYRAFKNKHRNL